MCLITQGEEALQGVLRGERCMNEAQRDVRLLIANRSM